MSTELISQVTFDKNRLENAYTHDEYIQLIDKLLIEGKTTGEDHSPDMMNYAKLNRQRMKRVSSYSVLFPELLTLAKQEGEVYWLVITEGWCGDASQIVPFLDTLAKQSPNIDLRLVLRDENLDIMDNYLTNGGRAIPILVSINKETMTENWHWGPRASVLQNQINQWKVDGLEKDALIENTHAWYAKDKSYHTQLALREKLESYHQKA